MELLAFQSGTAWASGAHTAWWRSHDARMEAWLAADEVLAARVCTRFAPFAAHIAALQQAGLTSDHAQSLLRRLQQRGLLVGTAAIAPPPEPALAPVPMPLIAVRTYRRSASLRQTLQSLLDDEQHYGVHRRVLVIDDSDTDTEADENASVVAELHAAGLNLGHFSPSLREDLLRRLEANPQHGSIDLISPARGRTATGGRSFNLALLLGAGGTLSLIDDDIRFPAMWPEGSVREWSLWESLSNEGRYYDDALPQWPRSDEEPFSWLTGIVGQKVGHLWHRDGVLARQLGGLSPSQLLAWSPERRVLAASSSILGGHVFNSSVLFSISDSRSLDHLLRPPFTMSRLDGERTWQGVMAPRLTRAAVYTPMLLDLREFVPFTTALGKGDDTGFMGMLRAVEPDGAYAYVPLTLGHQPIEDRQRRARAHQELILDGNHYLGYFAESCGQSIQALGRVPRLNGIATRAEEALAGDPQRYAAELQLWRGRRIAEVLEALFSARQRIGAAAPHEWVEFLQGINTANRRTLDTPMPGERVALYRRVLTQLISGAAVWPEWQRRMHDGLALEFQARSGLR